MCMLCDMLAAIAAKRANETPWKAEARKADEHIARYIDKVTELFRTTSNVDDLPVATLREWEQGMLEAAACFRNAANLKEDHDKTAPSKPPQPKSADGPWAKGTALDTFYPKAAEAERKKIDGDGK